MIGKTLTGLEAIRSMEEGYTIIEKCANNPRFFKIEDDVIKTLDILSECWVKSISFDLSVDYKVCDVSSSLTGWHNKDTIANFYVVHMDGKVVEEKNCCCKEYADENRYGTKEKAEEINFKQTLFRKLQRFSDENGGNEIDWNDRQTPKFNICYDYGEEEITAEWFYDEYYFGSVYFISEEIAQQAIELFHDDLIKYFTM